MKPSRRAFIAAGAALPAASIIPTSAVSAESALPDPLPPTPYTEYPWRWMVSHDDYMFSEDFETAAEAIKYAIAEGGGYIAECQMQDYRLDVDGDSVIEMLLGQNEDLIGEGEFLDPNREQTADLGKMVTEAIERWAVKHKISLTAWSFGDIRNRQKVDKTAALSDHQRKD